MCVCVWRGGGGKGGGGGCLFTTSSQQQVLYLHTFISKTFSRRFLTVNIVLITACDLFQLCPCFSGPC